MNLAKHAEVYHQIKQEHYFKKLSEELEAVSNLNVGNKMYHNPVLQIVK